MELLKAEIDRKRKATEDLIRKTNDEGASGLIGKTKFILQSALSKAKVKEREEAQRSFDEEKSKRGRINELGKVDAHVSTSKNDSTAANNKIELAVHENNTTTSLNVDIVKARLRIAGQPATLYGESDIDRENRLLSLEKKKALSDDTDEFRLQSAYAQENTRAVTFERSKSGKGGADGDEDDFDAEDEIEAREERQRQTSGANVDDESDDDEDERRGSEVRAKELTVLTHYGTRKDLSDEKIVYKYYRNLLKLWEWDLNARDDRDKLTAKGKMETKTQKQCKDYIRPLFKMCKRKEVVPDILIKLLGMVKYCEDGNFRAAHDLYLQTAIGNAAWPIGLTMVGIHERSGREKISTSKVAHVMNNELQRKYLTSVKRLMTFAQTKRTDVPPSMKIL